jgi:UDP-N-acetyl-D-mannosaminuronate dehydrogenase
MKARRRPVPLVDAAMTLIAGRPRKVVERAREMLADRGRALRGSRVLVVGVAYKPGVADLRESPALEIIEELDGLGAQVGFLDDLADGLRLDGKTRHSEIAPQAGDWDLVLVHTVHPGVDLSWLDGHPAVLDATYRLAAGPGRETL